VSLQSGTNNTAIGNNAGSTFTTGDNNIFLGQNAQNGGNDSGNIVIGPLTATAGTSNRTFVANIHGQAVGVTGLGVFIDATGLLGTSVSSRIFKENINSIQDDISAKLMSLNPVTFTFKSDKEHALQFGLIAEEVSEVLPEIVFMKKGDDGSDPKPHSVKYEQIIPMLLFEIQKLNKEIVPSLSLEIQKLNKEIEILKNIKNSDPNE